jgi:hypothetical protein
VKLTANSRLKAGQPHPARHSDAAARTLGHTEPRAQQPAYKAKALGFDRYVELEKCEQFHDQEADGVYLTTVTVVKFATAVCTESDAEVSATDPNLLIKWLSSGIHRRRPYTRRHNPCIQ